MEPGGFPGTNKCITSGFCLHGIFFFAKRAGKKWMEHGDRNFDLIALDLPPTQDASHH